MASWSEWSDTKKWFMGIFSALIVAAVIGVAGTLLKIGGDPAGDGRRTTNPVLLEEAEQQTEGERAPTSSEREPEQGEPATTSAVRDRSSVGRSEAEPEIPLRVQSNPVAPAVEGAKGSSGALITTGAPSDAPDSRQRRAVPRVQGFQTESYFLRIENIRRRGATVEVDLLLESQRSEAFRFALSEPYMLDSHGTRLDILRDDSGGFVGRGLEVLPNTRLRGSLSFCVMTKPSTIRVGGFAGSSPACTGESVEGGEFTLAADEVFPQTRRKLILRTTEGG